MELNLNKKWLMILALLGANMLYACQSIFTKLASGCEPLSWGYVAYICCSIAVLGVYAIIWQQIIKRVPISDAYMFKGSVIIFVLIISAVLFGEQISTRNVIGAAMIIAGIAISAKS